MKNRLMSNWEKSFRMSGDKVTRNIYPNNIRIPRKLKKKLKQKIYYNPYNKSFSLIPKRYNKDDDGPYMYWDYEDTYVDTKLKKITPHMYRHEPIDGNMILPILI